MCAKSNLVPFIGVMLAIVSGCASHESRQMTQATATLPSVEVPDQFCFDDVRCSMDQRRAIRAATQAVLGTDTPSASVAERLRFTIIQVNDGWSLNVRQYGPNEVPLPGEFVAVLLNRDFTVRSVVGGA